MGQFIDNFESAMEHIGNYDDVHVGKSPILPYFELKYKCPKCGERFVVLKDLQNHLFANHRELVQYVSVNDSIITSSYVTKEPIRDIRIYSSKKGITKANISSPEWSSDLSFEFDTSMQVYPSEKLQALPNTFRIAISGSEIREYELVRTESDSPSFDEVESLYFEFQNKFMNNPSNELVIAFKDAIDSKRLNGERLIYVNGLYDYLCGVYYEQSGTSRYSALLERAHGSLLGIQTKLAWLIRSCLSLKLCWFHQLVHLPGESMFHIVGQFFNSSYDNLPEAIPIIHSETRGVLTVYLDDFHVKLIHSVYLFMINDPKCDENIGLFLREYGDKLDNNYNVSNQMKIALLLTRYYRKKNQVEESRKYANYLIHYPPYDKEAT
jgi:hypothetical protein